MNILFLNLLMEADSLGGAEKSLLLLLENLDKDRFNPILATNQAGTLSRYAADAGCKVHLFKVESEALTIYRDTFSLNPLSLFKKYLKLKASIKELAEFIQTEKIDLIYSNNIRSHILGVFLAKKVQKPLVWHFRDIIFGKMRFTFNFLAKRFPTKIIAVSNAVAKNFTDTNKLEIIYNGIDTASFADAKQHDIRSELGIPKAAPLVALIGRLTRLKRPQDFIEAAAIINKTNKSARFLLVGDMAFERDKNFQFELMSLKDKLNLEKEVIFTGLRTDIFTWLSNVDVIILISEHEAFPRVLLEAMAAAVPVVATGVGGIPEIVVDNETGFLIDVADVESLAQKITLLLSDKARAKAMGLSGYKRVAKHFSLQGNVNKIEHTLLQLLSEVNS